MFARLRHPMISDDAGITKIPIDDFYMTLLSRDGNQDAFQRFLCDSA
jgi:hypothetical protein